MGQKKTKIVLDADVIIHFMEQIAFRYYLTYFRNMNI